MAVKIQFALGIIASLSGLPDVHQMETLLSGGFGIHNTVHIICNMLDRYLINRTNEGR